MLELGPSRAESRDTRHLDSAGGVLCAVLWFVGTVLRMFRSEGLAGSRSRHGDEWC